MKVANRNPREIYDVQTMTRKLYKSVGHICADLNSGGHAWRRNLGAVQGASRPEAGKGDAIDGLHCQHPPQGAPQVHGGVGCLHTCGAWRDHRQAQQDIADAMCTSMNKGNTVGLHEDIAALLAQYLSALYWVKV